MPKAQLARLGFLVSARYLTPPSWADMGAKVHKASFTLVTLKKYEPPARNPFFDRTLRPSRHGY
ncbi:hypothetical protein GCM10027594_01470 [Hymenobacter agri]